MTELQIFHNPEFGQVRSLVIDDQPWFVGKDVAEALGYKDTVNALKTHIDDEDSRRWRIATPSGEQGMKCINESGIYSLILSSHLPSAKKFKHWVTSEVLPTIRKTGSYGTTLDCMGAAQMILKASKEQLPFVVSLLRQQGYDLPELPVKTTGTNRWADRANTTDMRKLMEEHHVSIRELENRTNICRSSLSNYMNGRNRPTKERYEIIVQAIIS